MIISPSVISCKLENLKYEIEQSVLGGAGQFHLDIMDGHFVPNITMGSDLLKAVRRCTDLPLEAHMMVTYPSRYWKVFADAGADILLFHYESNVPLLKCFKEVKEYRKNYGIVLNPETPFDEIKDILDGASMLVLMSVHPGFSGQSFIEGTTSKIKKARNYIDENGLDTLIEIDGGINDKNASIASRSGADILVSASYIYGGVITERIRKLKSLSSLETE